MEIVAGLGLYLNALEIFDWKIKMHSDYRQLVIKNALRF